MKLTTLFFVLTTSLTTMAQSYSAETAEATSLVQNTNIHSSYHYCLAGKLTCRTLVLLKDKVTDLLISDFYDVFLSSERAVGSTGYFVQNPSSSSFHAYLDDAFDGQILVTKKDMDNQSLTISFDGNNFPTIHGVNLKRVGTTRYILADMTYASDKATIIGTEYDTANSSYANSINIEYARVQQ